MTPPTTDPPAFPDARAARVAAVVAVAPVRPGAAASLPAALLAVVRQALLDGDTHYTSRPGSPALRAAIGRRLAAQGYPHADGDTDLVVTAGVEEALTVVALALPRGRVAVAPGAERAAAALGALGFEVLPAAPPPEPVALVYSTRGRAGWDAGQLVVHDIGSALWQVTPPAFGPADRRTIVIGDVDALPGMATFRVGFAAAPADLMRAVRTWKQALSICTAAPSQRAALWAVTAAGEASR